MGHVDDEVIGKKGNYHLYGKFGLPGTSTKKFMEFFWFLISGNLKHVICKQTCQFATT
jgi:hypothetical protein